MNNNTYILFYSNKCPTCLDLIKILQNENLINYFSLFSVDERLNKLPIPIEVVPTMIVPEANKPLVAHEAFEWIKKIKFIKQKKMIDMNKKIIQNNLMQMVKNNQNNPIGFKESEMSSISDPFAYKDIDEAMPQNFVDLNDKDSKHAIFTAPEKNKLNKSQQVKLIENIEKNRKEQDEKYSLSMQEGRMLAVQKAENDNYQQNNSQNNSHNQQNRPINYMNRNGNNRF